MKPSMRPRAPAILALLAACARPPVAPQVSSAVALPAPAAAEVARWVLTGGATRVGPQLARGTLVLLGGRRALVRTDGGVESEVAPAPEPLDGIVLVPTAGGDRLIGHGRRGVYAFEDPLGAPTVLAHDPSASLLRIGAGPGWIAVWGDAGEAMPVVLDAVTGAERKVEGWPAVGIEDVAFRSVHEGAVIFGGLGVAVTVDGGATFRQPSVESVTDRTGLSHLSRRGDDLRASDGASTYPLDLAGARMGPLLDDAVPTEPTLRWIVTTGLDPLAVAVAHGIRGVPRETALVAYPGLLARVRLDTGAIVEVAGEPFAESIPRSKHAPCDLARRGGQGILLCAGQDLRSFPLAGELGRWHPAIGPHGLDEYAPRPRFGPGGGVAFRGHGAAAGPTAIYVLGGGEALETVRVPVPEGREIEQIAPLADGRLAWLADPQPSSRDLHFVIGDAAGATRVLPPFEVGEVPERVAVLALEEGIDEALHAVLSVNGKQLTVRQPLRGGDAEVELITGWVLVRDGHGMRLDDGLSISEDGGARWASAPGPSKAAYGRAVGENGLQVDGHLRVGWGGAAPFAPSPVPAAGSALAWPSGPWPSRRLVCTRTGDGGPAVPLTNGDGLRASLFDGQSGPAPDGGGQEIAGELGHYDDTAVSLEAYARDPLAASPTRWTLRWVDPHDPAGGSGRATFPPPPEARWKTYLEARSRTGRRLVVAIFDDQRKGLLVDVPSRGPPRLVADETELAGNRVFVAGRSDGDPVAMKSYGALFVWPVGGALRPLAYDGGNSADVILGPPTVDAVPVLLRGQGWASFRNLPLGDGPAGPLPLDGWLPVPAPFGQDVELPVCRRESRGPVFRGSPDPVLRLEIDGRQVDGDQVQYARFEVRIDGAAACLTHVDVAVSPERTPRARGNPLGHLDVDLIHGTGRGLETGPKARVQRLRCALE